MTNRPTKSIDTQGLTANRLILHTYHTVALNLAKI